MNECYENTLRKGRTFPAGLNDVTLARVPWNLTACWQYGTRWSSLCAMLRSARFAFWLSYAKYVTKCGWCSQPNLL